MNASRHAFNVTNGRANASLLIRQRRRAALLAAAAFAGLGAFGAGAAIAQDANAPAPIPTPQPPQAVVDYLSSLDAAKLTQLFQHLGLKPPEGFEGCLCPNGFHRYSGPEGPCRYRGPLWGNEYRDFDTSKLESCALAYRLPDGRTVLDAVASAAKATGASGVPGEQTSADAIRAASPFLYSPWPKIFEDVPPSNIIYTLDERSREKFAGLANTMLDKALRNPSIAMTHDLEKSLEWAAQVAKTGEVDVRYDEGDWEIGFILDERGVPSPNEFVWKAPLLGEGKNIEVGFGMKRTLPGGGGPLEWDGKLKVGYSREVETGGGQAEGKYGFEFDTEKIGITSLDDEPEPMNPSLTERVRSGLEKYLAAVDVYFGGAWQPTIGPEATWHVKDIYTDAVFEDMNKALDNMVQEQKGLEERRHEYFRNMAKKMGVDPSGMTIGEVTKEIHHAIIQKAMLAGVPVEGRSIRDIRQDLQKRGLLGQ